METCNLLPPSEFIWNVYQAFPYILFWKSVCFQLPNTSDNVTNVQNMKAALVVCWVTVHRGLVLVPELKSINLEIIPQKFNSLDKYVGGSGTNMCPKLGIRNVRWGCPTKSLPVWGTKQMRWDRVEICFRTENYTSLAHKEDLVIRGGGAILMRTQESGTEILLAHALRDTCYFLG